MRYLLFLPLLLTFSSCRNDKANFPQPVSGCDSIHVSYHNDIQPILRMSCYSCHGTAVTATGGLDLENWNSLKSYLQNDYHADSIYGSKFFHIVNQQGLVPYMPPAGKLSSCELAKIHRWISDGAPAN